MKILRIISRSVTVALAAILMQIAAAETHSGNIHFASNPALSPDGETIYFSYDGDIFKVPAKGGLALRLVSIGGVETRPKPSPDGKWIAFASDIQGNNDIYVVSVEGGDVRRLTWHDANDIPASWTPDSKFIYFESTRASARSTTFKVSLEGGTPQRLYDGHFNTVVNLVENPVTGEVYFNESGESINFPTRKGYVGDHNPNIKCWHPANKEYSELTDWIGKDTWPMVDSKGNLYYVSDEFNGESNIVQYVKGGDPRQITTFNSSVHYPSISFDGSAIVFMKDYLIQLLNPVSGETFTPPISIAQTDVEVRHSLKEQKPTVAAISPDGKIMALAIRGLLFVSDPKCTWMERMITPADERVHEIVWAPDNLTIYFTRTEKGRRQLYKIGADGKSAEQLVYASNGDVKNLKLNHKGDKMVFIDGESKVMALATGSDITEQVAQAQFWSFHSYSISFSYDDRYMAFEAVNMFERDVYIYDFENKELENLTRSASSESEFVFSPDGKNAFLLANPTTSLFPRGGGDVKLYKLPLQKYETPFKSDEYDHLFSKPPKKDSSVIINYKDIFRRMVLAGEGAAFQGSQRGLYVFHGKGKSWLFWTTTYPATRKSQTYALDLTKPDEKPKEVKDLERVSFFSSKNELYALSRGDIVKIDITSLSTTKIKVSKDVEKTLNDEFRQMFYEVWALLDQNFYDPTHHGIDWKAIRDKYSAFLPYVVSRAQLRTLITDMLGELNSSHLGFTSRGAEESTRTRSYTLETGIVFNTTSPYVIDRILTDSPADKVDVELCQGDRLVAVNGVRVDEKSNRESCFSTVVNVEEITCRFEREGKEFDIKLHTTSSGEMKNLYYTEWEDICRERTHRLGNERIAYVHMRDMGDASLRTFLSDMHTYAVNKDALILDLRYNNGGNVHKEVIDFLRGQEHFRWSYRDFPKTSHPNVAPADKPIVVLVNERSLSDAEVTSNGIKTLGIAPIVGTETYRWIIFTSSVTLVDGSFTRMPAWGCYNLEDVDLESIGVAPDVYIRNTFKDRLNGDDPQLDKAIEMLNSQLEAR